MKEDIKILPNLAPYGTNCYLLTSQGILIDPGCEGDYILKTTRGFIIKYIINTHCHIDHIIGNDKIRDKTGALLLTSEKDAPMLPSPSLNLSAFFEKALSFRPPDRTIKDSEKIEDVLVISTPGHTPGSLSLLFNNYIFSGDLIFSNGYGRSDFPGGNFEDLKNSIRKLLNFPPDTILYPGHGEPLTIKNAKWELLKLIDL